jgi:hypothetical protein
MSCREALHNPLKTLNETTMLVSKSPYKPCCGEFEIAKGANWL